MERGENAQRVAPGTDLHLTSVERSGEADGTGSATYQGKDPADDFAVALGWRSEGRR